MIWPILILVIGLVLIAIVTYWTHFSSYSQFFGQFQYRAKTSEKVIALTFDDGPNEPYTSEILKFLDSQNIKATFFQVGECVKRYPEITKRIHKSGHTIGNHSHSHRFSNYLKNPQFEREIKQTQEIINETIGKTPALFRPPWLYRQSVLLKTLNKLGLTPVSGVFCSALEVFQPKGTIIAKHTLAKARPGAIIIFHDGYDAKGGNRRQTVEAVKLVVEALQKQDYMFVTVNELLDVPAYLK